jgi:uncharacterized protein (TIRG00374 family)
VSKGKLKVLHVSWMWPVVPAIVAFVAYSNRGSLAGAFRLLGHASLWWLGLAVLAVGGVYVCRASVYGVPLTLALGVAPPVWAVCMAFVVSTAGLAVISAPGGMGGFEVIMTAFLASVGLDKAQAIAGVILYRLVAFWLPLILSAALLWQFRRRRPGIE